jgi:hypothetical protein
MIAVLKLGEQSSQIVGCPALKVMMCVGDVYVFFIVMVLVEKEKRSMFAQS